MSVPVTDEERRRPGETWERYVARRNPPRESGLCPLCWPQHERPSLDPPYGACGVCVKEANGERGD